MCPLCLWVEGLRPEKLRDLFKITATSWQGQRLNTGLLIPNAEPCLLFKHSFLNVCL